jgi:hypothetical protein
MYLPRIKGKYQNFQLIFTCIAGLFLIIIGVIGFVNKEAIILSRSFDNSRNIFHGYVVIFINFSTLLLGFAYTLDPIYAYLKKKESDRYNRDGYMLMDKVISICKLLNSTQGS